MIGRRAFAPHLLFLPATPTLIAHAQTSVAETRVVELATVLRPGR
jgi:hypothetical protein